MAQQHNAQEDNVANGKGDENGLKRHFYHRGENEQHQCSGGKSEREHYSCLGIFVEYLHE